MVRFVAVAVVKIVPVETQVMFPVPNAIDLTFEFEELNNPVESVKDCKSIAPFVSVVVLVEPIVMLS